MSIPSLHLALASAACALSVTACSPPSQIRAEDGTTDSLVFVPPEDAAMNRALEAARGSLDLFFDAWAHNDGDNSEFGVKLAKGTDNGSEEHIWLWLDEVQGDKLVGHVAVVPVAIRGLKRGDKLAFTRQEIEDWTFERGGRAYGQFTTRAMLNHAKTSEEQAEAKEILASLWPNAIPEKH